MSFPGHFELYQLPAISCFGLQNELFREKFAKSFIFMLLRMQHFWLKCIAQMQIQHSKPTFAQIRRFLCGESS